MSTAVILAVLGAGAVGAMLRYCASRAFARRRGFPWAVLVVNVVGSAIGGAVLGFAQTDAISADVRLILLTGFCGGLTTFSTFSVETIQLVLDGRARVAVLSVAANLVIGISAAAGVFLLVVGGP